MRAKNELLQMRAKGTMEENMADVRSKFIKRKTEKLVDKAKVDQTLLVEAAKKEEERRAQAKADENSVRLRKRKGGRKALLAKAALFARRSQIMIDAEGSVDVSKYAKLTGIGETGESSTDPAPTPLAATSTDPAPTPPAASTDAAPTPAVKPAPPVRAPRPSPGGGRPKPSPGGGRPKPSPRPRASLSEPKAAAPAAEAAGDPYGSDDDSDDEDEDDGEDDFDDESEIAPADLRRKVIAAITDYDDSLPENSVHNEYLSQCVTHLTSAQLNAAPSGDNHFLMEAVKQGKVGAVIQLMYSGAKAAAVPVGLAGESLMHKAVALDSPPDLISALVEGGMAVDSVDDEGRTPLHYACQGGNAAIIQLLIDYNSDINAVDCDGNGCAFFTDPGFEEARETLTLAGLSFDVVLDDAPVSEVKDKVTAIFEKTAPSGRMSVNDLVALTKKTNENITAEVEDLYRESLQQSAAEQGWDLAAGLTLDQFMSTYSASAEVTTHAPGLSAAALRRWLAFLTAGAFSAECSLGRAHTDHALACVLLCTLRSYSSTDPSCVLPFGSQVESDYKIVVMTVGGADASGPDTDVDRQIVAALAKLAAEFGRPALYKGFQKFVGGQ